MFLHIIKLLYLFITIATFIFETMLIVDLGVKVQLPRYAIISTVLQSILPTLLISACPIINLMILITVLTSWDALITASLHKIEKRYNTGGKNE